MNYLAHIYLSGENDDLKIGNFIADAVKGKNYKNYPESIQRGILLHRAIDTYTDSHPVVFQASHRLFPHFRHYASVIIDMLFDHFLATHWSKYTSENLIKYAGRFYRLVEINWEYLPKRVKNFFPYMKKYDWLVTYRDLEGLQRILKQMSNRVVGGYQLDEAIPFIEQNYKFYEREFFTFFPELIHFVRDRTE